MLQYKYTMLGAILAQDCAFVHHGSYLEHKLDGRLCVRERTEEEASRWTEARPTRERFAL